MEQCWPQPVIRQEYSLVVKFKGTVIRVFSVPSGEKLFQFRRGAYVAKIHSLSFNQQDTLLAVSSDSDTVHVFKLMTPHERSQEVKEQQRLDNLNSDRKKSMFEAL